MFLSLANVKSWFLCTFVRMNKARRHEIIFYLTLWTLVFIAPVVAYFIQKTLAHEAVSSSVITDAWRGFAPYVVLFWLHDVFVAPYMVRHGTLKKYVLRAIVLLFIFAARIFVAEPSQHGEPQMPHEPMPDMEMRGDMHTPPPPKPKGDMHPPQSEPISLSGMLKILMGMMVCGANVGCKFYFKARRDEAVAAEREQQSLKKELEFLTYQINPHFFMNTLNNIHALIDIDPEKAKNTVIELSRMMRYALYDTKEKAVPVAKEIDFLNHYITLMRLRYTDKVDVKTDFTAAKDEAMVPPLLLVTFVENAFKHGVSYREESFIHVSMTTDLGFLTFKCLNSRHKEQNNKPHGIGLDNVKKRLALIYGDDFNLIIKPEESTFSVLLTIPTRIKAKI